MLPLDQIDNHLLFDIFKKMPNIPLCRMRQTCKFTDSFAEEHRQKLSSRVISNFKITISSFNRSPSYEDIEIRFPSGGFRRLNLFNFEKELSAVALEEVKIEFLSIGADEVDKLLENLNLLPIVGKVSMKYTNSGLMCKISEVIQVRNEYSLNGFNVDEDGNLILDNLNMSSKRGKFCITNLNRAAYDANGFFDRVRQFREFLFSCKFFEARTFLQDMLLSNDPGVLKNVHFSFCDRNWPTNYTIDGIRFTAFWDPQLEQSFQRRLDGDSLLPTPLSVRYAKVHNKYAMVYESECSHFVYALRVVLCDDLNDIWMLMFKDLQIDPSREKEFMETMEEEKEKKLRDLFVEMGERKMERVFAR